jgi:hypothetical protein
MVDAFTGPAQPIGYIAPAPGRRLALGLADPLDGPELQVIVGPLTEPRLVDTLGAPTLRTRAEGIVTAGRGQAPTPASSAPLWGLCAT